MSRTLIFLIIFSVLNIAFIPLMSLYGLAICPILKKGGFWIGCSYSTIFVLILNAVNILFVVFSDKLKNLKIKPTVGFLLIYLIATLTSIFFMNYIFSVNLITETSRGPQVIITASLLLGITQYYGLFWIKKQSFNTSNTSIVPQDDFSKLWKGHILKISLPVLALILTLLTFIFRQSFSWNHGRVSNDNVDDVVKQFSLLALFLIFWLTVTYAFYFLSEKDQLEKIELHFKKILDLNFKYISNTNDSWGLWKAFLQHLNNFSALFAQKNMLLKNFSKFVSESVANTASNIELENKSGQQRELTVISTDIRDFTKISYDYPAQTVVDILNQYFETVLEVFTRHNIAVDKFIGDGILSYVDLPDNKLAESNNSAVKACLEIQVQLEILNTKLVQQKLPALRTGIGIYRGPLILGLIGAKEKIQHTIIGDSVNRAARLEGLTKDLNTQIIITEQIYNSLDESLQMKFNSAGKQKIKGIEEALTVFALKTTNETI